MASINSIGTTAVIIATLATAAPAIAGSVGTNTGNELYADCLDDSGFSRGICSGYVIGALDAYINAGDTKICMPAHVTNGQIVDVFIEYARRNPKARHKQPAIVVWFAMVDAFPCSNT
jgi:hypothetical protein